MGNFIEENPTTNYDYVERRRAGFVTFWIWLGIIGSVLSLPGMLLQLSSLSNLGEDGIELRLQGFDLSPFTDSIDKPIYLLYGSTFLTAILNIWGMVLLLKWKKSGFFLFTFAAVISIVMQFFSYPMIQEAYNSIGYHMPLFSRAPYMALFGGCLGISLFWLILQIKKNGVSCWAQLK